MDRILDTLPVGEIAFLGYNVAYNLGIYSPIERFFLGDAAVVVHERANVAREAEEEAGADGARCAHPRAHPTRDAMRRGCQRRHACAGAAEWANRWASRWANRWASSAWHAAAAAVMRRTDASEEAFPVELY